MRILLACVCVFTTGCATTLQGGVQASTEGEGVVEEGIFVAGAGLGDGHDGALLVKGRATLGADPRTGAMRGTALIGYEWLKYGGEYDTVRHGSYFGIYGGGRLDTRDRGLVYAELGHAWVVGRSDEGNTITALTFAPMLGVSIVGKDADREHGQRTDMMVGLGLGVRSDTFSSWHFHL